MVARARRSVAGVLAVGLAGALAACGGGGGSAETSSVTTAEPTTVESTTTTAAPTTATPVVREDEAVLAAYQGYWTTWNAANDPPDPNFPELERYASGELLQRTTSAIQRRREVGEVLRIPEAGLGRHHATVEDISDGTAELVDCSVDDGIVVDARTGNVLDDAVATWAWRASLVKKEGRWLVDDILMDAQWDGVAGCAA